MEREALRCPHCGATLKKVTRFCTACGNPLPLWEGAAGTVEGNAPQVYQKRRPARGRVLVGVLLGVFSGLVAIVVVLLVTGRLSLVQDMFGKGLPIPTLAKDVDVSLVSLDATNYPVMRAYLTVTDGKDAYVPLTSPDVTIKEGIADNEPTECNVRSFAKVAGNQGVRYGLVVDKSADMEKAMPRVRQALSDFLASLDFDKGDQAELISFDSYIMYLCAMTSDESLLQTGVSSMEPWGESVLWDALYEGVTSMGSQGGARCVVAFSDGADTSSSHTADDVVALAQSLNVPVFIVGTSDTDAATLRDLAQRCEGSYMAIDNVGDLPQALESVRDRERGMWCLEYECDDSTPADAERNVVVELADDSNDGRAEASMAPTAQSLPARHTSRYELVRSNVSWTAANEECMRRGGHLATITSQEEMDTIISMAEEQGMRYLWLGGYTSVRGRQAFGHWVTGERFDFQPWYPGEPSRTDVDGTPEVYILLWKPKSDGPWSFNDVHGSAFEDREMRSHVDAEGYVCEWEDEA